MPKNGKDYEFLPKPERLPTPPVDYSLSKPARAFQEAFTPRVGLDELRSKLTVMGGPAAGYGNFAREAVRGAAGMLGDFKTLGSEPALSQPWWNAAVRTGTEALGAARILHGGKRGGVEGTGPIIRLPKNLASATELPPPPFGVRPYKLSPPVSGEQYLESFRKATAANDEVGALNIVRNAAKSDQFSPSLALEVMKHPSPYVAREFFRHLDAKLGRPQPPY